MSMSQDIIDRYAAANPGKLAILERFARAGDPDDCGHVPAKRAKGGKFDLGNTCAGEGGGGGGGGEAELEGHFPEGREYTEEHPFPLPRTPVKEQKLGKSGEPLKAGSKKPLEQEMFPKEAYAEGLYDYMPAEIRATIKSKAAMANANYLWEGALADELGDLPSPEVLGLMAKIGESTRGQYEWTGNVMNQILGERNAKIWAALNSVLSARTEYRQHTMGSLRLLRYWLEAGEPTDEDKINEVIFRLGTTTEPSETGRMQPAVYGLIGTGTEEGTTKGGLKKGQPGQEDKWAGIKRVLQNPDSPLEGIASSGELAQKTPQFARAWTDEDAFTWDKWMSRLTHPKFKMEDVAKILGKDGVEDLLPDEKEGMIPGQAALDLLKRITARQVAAKPGDTKEPSPKGKTPEEYEAAKARHEEALKTQDLVALVEKVQVGLIKSTGPYQAFIALSRKTAEQLGDGWTPREVQEAAWSAAIAISTMKAHYPADTPPEEIVKKLTHEMVKQSWDIQTIMRDKGVRRDFDKIQAIERRRRGGEGGTPGPRSGDEGAAGRPARDLSSWEEFTDKPQPPQHGPIKLGKGDRALAADIVGRIPKAGIGTRRGKSVLEPKRGGGVKRVGGWGAGKPEEEPKAKPKATTVKVSKHIGEFDIERFFIDALDAEYDRYARAGDPDDCGHRRDGGHFDKGNTCWQLRGGSVGAGLVSKARAAKGPVGGGGRPAAPPTAPAGRGGPPAAPVAPAGRGAPQGAPAGRGAPPGPGGGEGGMPTPTAPPAKVAHDPLRPWLTMDPTKDLPKGAIGAEAPPRGAPAAPRPPMGNRPPVTGAYWKDPNKEHDPDRPWESVAPDVPGGGGGGEGKIPGPRDVIPGAYVVATPQRRKEIAEEYKRLQNRFSEHRSSVGSMEEATLPLNKEEAKAYTFTSPNTEEETKWNWAMGQIASPEHKAMINQAKEIDESLGLRGHLFSGVGEWADGAENSVVSEYTNAKSYEQVAYAAAVRGMKWNQKAVIPFIKDPNGKDRVYFLSLKNQDMAKIRGAMDKEGIEYRTVTPGKTKTTITVFDKGSGLEDNVNRFINHFDEGEVSGTYHRGRGEFLGGETREQGVDAYRKFIYEYERRGLGRSLGLSGPGGTVPRARASAGPPIGLEGRYGRRGVERLGNLRGDHAQAAGPARGPQAGAGARTGARAGPGTGRRGGPMSLERIAEQLARYRKSSWARTSDVRPKGVDFFEKWNKMRAKVLAEVEREFAKELELASNYGENKDPVHIPGSEKPIN